MVRRMREMFSLTKALYGPVLQDAMGKADPCGTGARTSGRDEIPQRAVPGQLVWQLRSTPLSDLEQKQSLNQDERDRGGKNNPKDSRIARYLRLKC
jgi:hypothetical protein